MTPDELTTFRASAEALQKKYSRRRALWARHIGRPFSDEHDLPDPGVIDVEASEEG